MGEKLLPAIASTWQSNETNQWSVLKPHTLYNRLYDQTEWQQYYRIT